MKSLLSRRSLGWVCLLLLVIGTCLTGCRQARKLMRVTPTFTTSINVLIWKNYLPDDVIEDFQDEFGIQVNIDYIESNDELVKRLAQKNYDLVMPSSFKAKELWQQNLLVQLNPLNLPNLANLDGDAYNAKFDPTNRFMVPYIWGSTGIGYRSDSVDGIPKSWASLFVSPRNSKVAEIKVPGLGEPATSAATSGTVTRGDIHTVHNKKRRIALIDDARFTLGCALIYLKRPLDTASEADLREAGELIKNLGDEIVFIDSDNVPGMLARKELEMDMVMAWSGDATRAMRGFSTTDEIQTRINPQKDNIFVKNTAVRLALPTEGTLLFRDGFVVPKGVRNQEAAESFINYLLQPKVAGRVTNYSYYANTLKQEKVMSFVDRFIANSASYFTNPSGSRFNFTFEDIPKDAENSYAAVWADVKKSLRPDKYPGIRAGVYPHIELAH